MRRWRATLIAALMLSPALARADAPPEFAFEWSRWLDANLCPDRPQVIAELSHRIHHDPFRDGAPSTLSVALSHSTLGWYARLQVHGADGSLQLSREFVDDGDNCDGLTAAVVLAIELLLEVEPMTPASPPIASSPPPPPARSSPPPTTEREPARSIPRLRHGHIVSTTRLAAVAPIAVTGLLPDAALGLRASIDVPIDGRWRFATGADLFLPVTTRRGIDTSFTFAIAAAHLDLCIDAFRNSRLAVMACAGVSMGGILGTATSTSLEPEPSGPHLWLAGSTTARVDVRVTGPLWLYTGALLQVPITVYSFDVGGEATSVFQQQRLGIGGYAGIGLSL